MSSLLGLDIGRASIKAVQLSKNSNGGFALDALGRIETPPKWIESEAEVDKKALVESIKTLISESGVKTKRTVASLPDSKIFTRLITLPNLTEDELSSSIQWEADQYVPIPLEKVDLHWQVIEKRSVREGGKMEVLLVAAPKVLARTYVDILDRCGLELEALETESQALARSLIAVGGSQDVPTSLIVSLGRSSTDLAIVRKGKVVLTRSVSTGDEAFTRVIVDRLGFDVGQAEAYKNAYGIDKDKLDGKLAEALRPVVDVILSEIKRVAAFYADQRQSDAVRRIILSGAPSRLPGLVIYLATQLGYEVIIGDPWSRVSIDSSIEQQVKNEGAEYAISVGSAMRTDS